jgi:hypothetical protein
MRTVLLACIVVLAACQPVYLKDGRPNEDSLYFEVPVQSKFTLHQALTILPYRRNIYFQDGRAMPFYEVNEFIDYCALTLHAQRQVSQIVKADTFVVTKVYGEYLYQLADATLVVAQVVGGDDGEPWFVLATQMGLRSETQPDVVRMTCAGVTGARTSASSSVTISPRLLRMPATVTLDSSCGSPQPEPQRRRGDSGY